MQVDLYNGCKNGDAYFSLIVPFCFVLNIKLHRYA